MLDHNPKVIVFDIGGVLLDWRGGLISTAKILNITPNEVHDELKTYLSDLELGNMRQEYFWQKVALKFSYKGNSHDLAKAWIEGQPIIKTGWELAKQLKNKYRLVVCTNNWLGVVENQIKEIGDFDLFETIIDSSQEKVKKPDPKMYLVVEKITGYSGKDLFLIDDSKQNCEEAIKQGWQSFVFDMNLNEGIDSKKQIETILLN